MSENTETKKFEINSEKTIPIRNKANMKCLINLKKVGIDIKDADKINETRMTMLQDLEVTKGIAESVFDIVLTDEESENLDPISVREGLDYFLEKKCGVVFQEMGK